MAMNKITHFVFGTFHPHLSDNDVTQLYADYLKSEPYKNIRKEEQMYLSAKWQYMRIYFEAEELAEGIRKVNEEFYIKCCLQQRKNQYDKNNEKINEQRRELYALNKEKMHAKEKQYRDSHKEQIYERNKIYTELHKKEINERHKIKVTCECGAVIRHDYMTVHKMSIKHLDFINNIDS